MRCRVLLSQVVRRQNWRCQVDDAQQTFAYERYLEQRGLQDGVVRDDLPYSRSLDRIVEEVNRHFGAAFSHGEVYQAISHMARKPDLHQRGLPRESEVPLRGKART
jgi:hypothetical protein